MIRYVWPCGSISERGIKRSKLLPGQQWIYLPRTSVDDIAIVPIGVLLTVRYLFRAW